MNSVGLDERKRYAVALVPTLFAWPAENNDCLRLLLRLAYLISAHISFRLPMSMENLSQVERAFDEIIPDYQEQSKGILYVMTRRNELSSLLQHSTFVLTNEQGLLLTSALSETRRAVLTHSGSGRYSIRIDAAQWGRDRNLRMKVSACAKSLSIPWRTFLSVENHPVDGVGCTQEVERISLMKKMA